MNDNTYNQNMGQGGPNPQYSNMNYAQAPKKKNPIVKILVILALFGFGVIAIAIIFVSLVSANSNKLVCKSNEGNITIMYNDNAITGYTSNGMSYNLDEQKEYAKQIGVEAYLDEFNTWFETNTTGTCSLKEK